MSTPGIVRDCVLTRILWERVWQGHFTGKENCFSRSPSLMEELRSKLNLKSIYPSIIYPLSIIYQSSISISKYCILYIYIHTHTLSLSLSQKVLDIKISLYCGSWSNWQAFFWVQSNQNYWTWHLPQKHRVGWCFWKATCRVENVEHEV